MAKTVELMRHTANEGDALTPDGVMAATAIGRNLAGNYSVVASSGAQRATQTAGCLLAGLSEPVPGGVVVITGLRSEVEARWRAAYQLAGAGDLRALRLADPDLVDTDSAALAAGLRTVFSMLEDGERALAVGHSPTNEAAVFGLTGVMVEAMGKGDLVSLTERDGTFTVDDHPAGPLEPGDGDEEMLRHFKTGLWPRAYRTQDVELLDSLLHDSFQMIDADGKRSTKQAELAYVRDNAWDPDAFEYQVERLQLFGGRWAIIDGTGVASTNTYASSNVLIKAGGRWQAVASHVSGVQSTG